MRTTAFITAGFRGRTRGAILIVAIWVLFFLASLVLVFAQLARTDILACGNQVSTIQAATVARNAEAYAISLVDQQKESVLTLAESYFAGVQMEGGWFWILRPNWGDDAIPAFGISDESAKVDINAASADALLALPGMTADIAASIIDWRDSNSDATAGGAEDEYYLALPRPYRAKNGPFESVEELLLVKDITTDLLYGTGVGSRYLGEAAWDLGLGASARSDLQLARGIYDDLTIHNGAAASTGAGGGGGGGQGKVDVNDNDSRRLTEALKAVLKEDRAEDVAEKTRPRPPFRDLFDFALRGGLTADELDSLTGTLTAGQQSPQGGLINVNTAPQEVLLTLPGMTEGDVSSLLAQRGVPGTTTGIGWVFEALGARSVGLGNAISAVPGKYGADILAVSANGRAYRRTRIVIDPAQSPPKVVFRRDLTETGWPLDPAILLLLREGRGLSMGTSNLQGGL